jgi:hypothetical protein
MTEYSKIVENQAKIIAAEEWAKGVNQIHAHSLNSMWYDNRPQDTSEGKMVTDLTYNNGVVKRTCQDGSTVYFGDELCGDTLIDAYERNGT